MTDLSPEDQRRDADALRKALRRRTLLTWTARPMLVVAIVMALQPFIAHAGSRVVQFSMGTHDLLIGYPTATVFGVIALVIWGRKPVP